MFQSPKALIKEADMHALPLAHFRRRSYLARKGDKPTQLWLIDDGWAIGYKMLRDGRRHISRLYLPGDLCDPIWLLTDEVDQMVISLTDVKARPLDCEAIEARLSYDPELSRYLALDSLFNLRITSEWIVTLGCKSAVEKVGQFFCELLVRLNPDRSHGENQCDMPLSQQDIAEFTGMTPVHVCRTMKKLREQGLVEIGHKQIHFLNFDALAKLCDFDDRYLRGPTHRGMAHPLIAPDPHPFTAANPA